MAEILLSIFSVSVAIVFIGGGIFIFASIYNSYMYKIKWCEKCNTWEKMERLSGNISGWTCPKCKWIVQDNPYGCPSCGWYGKYENGLISRRGPFRKEDKELVNPMWGWKTVYMAFEERIRCPKHGEFVVYIPAKFYKSNDRYDEDYYSEEY